MKPVIQIKNIYKEYKINSKEPLNIVDGIDLIINKGECVALTGVNGAGKSTLFKMIAGVIKPTKGEIIIEGSLSSILAIGVGMHLELTGKENILLSGTILGMKRKEILSCFDEIVAFAELEGFLDMPVKFYSSGMFVRLAFSISVHFDSDLILFDEVLSVGDEKFQIKSLNKIKSLIQEGRTVLFISHVPELVDSLCTRKLIMQRGKIISDIKV